MSLTVREIYALAESVAPLTAPEEAAAAEDGSFQAVMDRATAALAAQTELPTFDEWAAAYQKDPASYDRDLIGFWRDQA